MPPAAVSTLRLAFYRFVDPAPWRPVQPLLPEHRDDHPLGCHRPRIPDRYCFEAILFRPGAGPFVGGCGPARPKDPRRRWRRRRRDERLAAGVFDELVDGTTCSYDRIVELDLSDVAIEGSQHKAPFGGEGTGPNPTDRDNCGWWQSVATDRAWIPITWEVANENRNDGVLWDRTLVAVEGRGLTCDTGTLHLDRGATTTRCAHFPPRSASMA
ncbi:MAG: hypothetical protein Q8K63_10905 [Acidimicrobiales bacterium]|nr:hypothetical protein [Acidimicrobiales bacterium]